MSRQGFQAAMLILTALWLAGCGQPQPPAPPPAPPPKPQPRVEQRWPNVAAVLAAAPATPLMPQEVVWDEETFLIDLPAGAHVIPSMTDNVIQAVVGDELVIHFRVGKEDLAFRKELETINDYPRRVQSYPYFDDELLIIEHDCAEDPKPQRCYEAFMHISDGQRDFQVWPERPQAAGDYYCTLPDILLALKCGRTLRVKTPYPDDPLELAKRLKLRLEENSGLVTAESWYHTTSGHLRLLPRLPQVQAVFIDNTVYLDYRTDLAPLAQLPDLRRLKFGSGHGLPDAVRQAFLVIGACKKLEDVYLMIAPQSAEQMQALGGLTELKRLTLRTERGSAPHFHKLVGLKKLEHLELWLNDDSIQSTGGLVGNLGTLAGLPALKSVKLSGDLTDVDLAEIGKLKNVETLDIHSWKLSGTFAGLDNLANLKELRFSPDNSDSKPLTAAAVAHLPKGLKKLCLDRFLITDEALAALGRHPALTQLRFDFCEFPGGKVQELAKLKTLQSVRFENAKNLLPAEIDALAAERGDLKIEQ